MHDHRLQRWLDLSMSTLLSVCIYLCTFYGGFSHLVSSHHTIWFSIMHAARPRTPCTDTIKCVNSFLWSSQGRSYFIVFSFSFFSITLSIGREIYVLAYVSITMISMRVSVWSCHIWRIWRYPWSPAAWFDVVLITYGCFGTIPSYFESINGG